MFDAQIGVEQAGAAPGGDEGRACAMALSLDASGVLTNCTPAARRLLEDGRLLALRGGRVGCACAASSVEFQAALRRLPASLAERAAPACENVMLRDDGCPRAVVSLYGLMVGGEMTVLMLVRLLPQPDEPVIADPAAVVALRHAYDITTAEAEIAVAAGSGASATEIAEARGRSLATVRTQIRSIHAKLGIRRQAELCRLVSSFR